MLMIIVIIGRTIMGRSIRMAVVLTLPILMGMLMMMTVALLAMIIILPQCFPAHQLKHVGEREGVNVWDGEREKPARELLLKDVCNCNGVLMRWTHWGLNPGPPAC
jgi:hypothetical protein